MKGLGTLQKRPLPAPPGPALPEAAAVGVIALRQELPQGPVDDDQGDGKLARLLGVPPPPPELRLPFGAGPRTCGLWGSLPADRPHHGTLCNVSESVRVGLGPIFLPQHFPLEQVLPEIRCSAETGAVPQKIKHTATM